MKTIKSIYLWFCHDITPRKESFKIFGKLALLKPESATNFANMKNTILLFLLFLSTYGYAQEIIFAPPPCLDSVLEEKPTGLWDRASNHFYGGDIQLLRYLNINLIKQLRDGKIPDGDIILSISIDTLGKSREVEIIQAHKSCTKCGAKIREVVERIHLWKPNCYYSILDNKILCRETQFFLHIKFEKKEIVVIPMS